MGFELTKFTYSLLKLRVEFQMAHRIVKKQFHSNHNQTDSPLNSSRISKPTSNIPQPLHKVRPIIEKTDQIIKHDRSSFQKNMPSFPPAQSLFTSDNNYDAGPNFIRTTSAVMMGNPKKRSFPYGAWVTPFGENNVPEVHVKSPLRCSRCKTYINGHFRFDGTKSSAQCNICGIKFTIQPTTDPKNLQSSRLSTAGVMDFVVTDKFYKKKRTDLIKIIVAIEINAYLWEAGIIHTVIQSLKSAIQNTQFPSKLKIAIVYYNNQGMKFQKLRKTENWKEKGPLIYQIKNSSTGMCCPLSDEEMLLDPNSQKQKLIFLFDCVLAQAEKYCQKKHGNNTVNYAMLLACLNDNFINQTGRVMIFTSSDPYSGLYPLRPRKQQQFTNQLKPLFNDYEKLGKAFAKNRLGVEMYMFSKESLVNHQLSTTHYLCSLTGGSLSYYPSYLHESNSQHLYYKVYSSLTKNYVYDVDYIMRVSNGLTLCGYGVGEGFRETRDITQAIMDPSSSLSVTFQHEQKIQENSSAYLQYAMMYTTGEGERKIRVINYRYPVVNSLSTLYEAGDYLTVANLLCRQYLSKLSKTPPQKVREEFISRLRMIVNEQTTPRNSFIHPNLLPMFMYVHTILNSRIFLNVIRSSVDARMAQILKVNSYNFVHFANKYYPKLYPLTMDIYEGDPSPGDYMQNEEEIAIIPTNIQLSKFSLKLNGIYLYSTPEELLMLVMSQAQCQLLEELFGTDNWEQIEENGLPELETSHNIRVNIIITELRRRNTEANGMYLPLLVRTPRKKGQFNELIKNICKQNYEECHYNHFIDIIHRKTK